MKRNLWQRHRFPWFWDQQPQHFAFDPSHWDFSKIVKPIKTSGKLDAKLLEDELKKSGSPILKINDIVWFLKKSKKIDERARSLLLKLSKYLEHPKSDFIITYGYDSAKESDIIADKFKCNTRSLIDYYGILKMVGKKVNMREKQKSVYNYPGSILAELN